MKRIKYIIWHDPDIVETAWSGQVLREGVNASDILRGDHQVDGEKILETFDKEEALAEFNKHHCDVRFTATHLPDDYQADIDYWELETVEIYEDEEDYDILDVVIAPFLRDVYYE